jgi:hypothetical protein
MNKVTDYISNERIATLLPHVQQKAIRFLNRVEKELGITLRVTYAYRSDAEQNAFYAHGRLPVTEVNILRRAAGLPAISPQENLKRITNAKAGQSKHNHRRAIDVVEMKDGKANWNTNWTAIGRIGKEEGFTWGGDFKTLIDKPHFEYNL